MPRLHWPTIKLRLEGDPINSEVKFKDSRISSPPTLGRLYTLHTIYILLAGRQDAALGSRGRC